MTPLEPMTDNEIAETVAREMPGWRVVRVSLSEEERKAALVEKWFGRKAAEPAELDTVNVVVRSGVTEKVIGVEGGKVVWRQG